METKNNMALGNIDEEMGSAKQLQDEDAAPPSSTVRVSFIDSPASDTEASPSRPNNNNSNNPSSSPRRNGSVSGNNDSGSGRGRGRDGYTAALLRAKTQRNVLNNLHLAAQHGGTGDVQLRTLASMAHYISEQQLDNRRRLSSGSISIGSEEGSLASMVEIPYGDESNIMAYSQRGGRSGLSSNVDHRRTNMVNTPDVLRSEDIMNVLMELGTSTHSLQPDGGDGLHHGVDEHHHHGHHHHHNGSGGRIPFYAHPRQRQRWGDDQVLPHINWGDLFFDLFYVAAAYNLGTLLMSALTPTLYQRGIVYFIGIFGPLYNCWESKLVYEARYSVGDYAHQILEILRVFLISFSVLHIKSIDLMSDPKSAETFFFCLGLFLESLVHIVLKVELIFVGQGDREAIRNHSTGKIYWAYLPQSLFYFSATLLSGMQLWETRSDTDGKRLLAAASSSKAEYSAYGDTTEDSFDGWRLADLPIAICLLAYVLNLLCHAIRKAVVLPKAHDFRKTNVPSNIDFSIHRYGEWLMLMLGEAVLSLLIVETTESTEYYVVAILGLLTVILLQAVKFESEPSHAEGHALWRNLTMGMIYSTLVQVLSMGLIAFGVSYKVMLKSIHKESVKSNYGSDYGEKDYAADAGYGVSDKSEYGADETAGAESYPEGYPEDQHRFLAPSVSTSDKAASALFCGSLTVVLIAMELMANSHRGTHDNIKHFLHPSEWRGETRGKVRFALFVFKLALIIFTATLSQWLTNLNHVAVAGFFIVGGVAISRIVWWNYVHAERKRSKKQRYRPQQNNNVANNMTPSDASSEVIGVSDNVRATNA